MEPRISQRPSRAPGRKSRGPGTRRSSQTPLKASDVRAFGRALDLLVRAIRLSAPTLEQAAQRAYSAWQTVRLLPLEVDAVDARVRGHSIVSPEQEIRWVLPAFMAGLRRITPRPEVTEMELRNLAEAIAHIDPNVASIEAFRDWIWSGAATGFELDLQSSFMEALDDAAMEREVEVNAALDQIRAESLRALSTRAELLSTRALARVAERDELDLPMCAPETHANAPEIHLAPDDAAALRGACDDAAGWVVAEIRLVTRQPALADTVRVDRFAKRLHEALKAAPQGVVAAVEAVAQRARHRDAFAMDLLQALDDAAFGAALGAALWRDPADVKRGVEVVLALGGTSAHAAMGPLLDRASADAEWAKAMKTVVESAGGRLDALLLQRPEVPNAGAVAALVTALGARALDALWTRALTEGTPWLGRAFATLCRAQMDAGRGAAVLVTAARDRGVNPSLRVEILDVLGADPALLAQAVSWRMAELLEPPVVRDRLKALRGRA